MRQSTNNVRWLLVGTGDIAAKRVAPALTSTEGGELVGICSRDRSRGSEFAERFHAKEVYEDLDQALDESNANAVYFATPVDCHVDQAIAATAAGKHILVEKPLGLDGSDARRAVEAARSANVLAACAYYRRCSSRYAHADQILASGLLGKVLFVRLIYHAWFSPAKDDPKHWRVEKARSGGGVLADMGCHMLDILVGLLGMPRSVLAKSQTLAHDYQVEDTASFLIELPGGAQVTGSFGWSSKAWANELEIIGTEGKLKWSPFDSGKVLLTLGREIHELELPPAENVHQPLIADFHEAMKTGHEAACPLKEAVKTNLLLDAIYRSAAEGREAQL